MAATVTRFSIKDGPSKFELMTALFDAKEVMFTLDVGIPTRIRITSVGIPQTLANFLEKDSWLIEGYGIGSSGSRKFKGCFNCRTRKGWMEFSPS